MVIGINHSNKDKISFSIFILSVLEEGLDSYLLKQGYYLPEKYLEEYERDMEAAYRLYSESYITTHEYADIIRKIVNNIQSAARKI